MTIRALSPLLALAVLLAPPPARAQATARRASRPATPPAASAAPASPAAPAPAAAPAPVSPGDEVVAPAEPPPAWFADREWRAGVALGGEFGLGDASFAAPKLRLDLSTTAQAINPRTRVDMVMSLGLLHAKDSQTISAMGYSFDVPWAANAFEFVPSARLTFALAPRAWLHAEAGIGGGWSAYEGPRKYDIPNGTGGTTTIDAAVKKGLYGVAHLGAGLEFAPDERFRIGAELLGLNLRVGNGVGTSLALLVTVSQRL